MWYNRWHGVIAVGLALRASVSFSEHTSSVSSSTSIELKPATTEKYEIKKGETSTFCYSPDETSKHTSSIFDDLVITVTAQAAGSYECPWHAVRGISSDDLHSNVESLVFRLLKAEDKLLTEEEKLKKVSFVRDIFSSCPSPVNARNRFNCFMHFSPYGKACVSVTPEASVGVTIAVDQEFNRNLALSLAAGVLLFFLAQWVCGSGIFQYIVGALLFVLIGVLLMVLYVVRYFLTSSPKKNNNSSSSSGGGGGGKPSHSLFYAVTAAATCSYGAGAVWFIRSNLKEILLTYWEVTLGYVALFAIFGLFAVKFMRKTENRKHAVKVVVKWIIRLVGVICVYNSSASPWGSMIMLALLTVLYITYEVQKAIREKISNGSTTKASGSKAKTS